MLENEVLTFLLPGEQPVDVNENIGEYDSEGERNRHQGDAEDTLEYCVVVASRHGTAHWSDEEDFFYIFQFPTQG
jgi:hypothetical protein